jgi:hypothetical protein
MDDDSKFEQSWVLFASIDASKTVVKQNKFKIEVSMTVSSCHSEPQQFLID